LLMLDLIFDVGSIGSEAWPLRPFLRRMPEDQRKAGRGTICRTPS